MSLLEVKNLGISFGGLRAVDGFHISIEKGQLYGLIGPNGAGKTTVFNMLTGVYTPNDGSITLDGVDITGKKTIDINKAGIARTFQNIRLFQKMSVLDNVMVGMHVKTRLPFPQNLIPGRADKVRKEAEARAEELLKILGLYEVRYEMATSLPYGDQRKVEICRALAIEPKLLLLDEPAAGMNIKESADLLELIRWINEELHKTIIFIEHNMRVVMNVSDYIYVLDHGTKISEGTPDVVSKDPVVIEAYLGTKKNGGETDAER